MCNQDSESIPHLFLQCQYARSLWGEVFNEFDLDTEVPDDLFHLLDQGSNKRRKRSIKSLWICAVWVVTWVIGKERNSQIFSEKNVSVSNLWDKVLFWVGI